MCKACFLEMKCYLAGHAERGKANELVSYCGSVCWGSLKSSTAEEIFLSVLGGIIPHSTCFSFLMIFSGETQLCVFAAVNQFLCSNRNKSCEKLTQFFLKGRRTDMYF